MKILLKISCLSFAMLLFANISKAQSSNIIDFAAGSKDHTTLVAAVKAADLVSTLKSKGPFTVFAPTNAEFAKLPEGTVEALLLLENKATLVKILTTMW